ncbi:MAG: hypothetical protein AB7I50_13710 [Vicinamibacterales bacterium]
MKPSVTIVLLVAGAFGVTPSAALSQDGGRAGYVLYRVASARGPFFTRFKAPTVVQTDASGGRAVVDLVYANRCGDQAEFTWHFDKDIRFLQPDETLTVTMAARINGNCGRDYYAQPSTGLIVREIDGTFSTQERQQLRGMQWFPGQTDAESRVWARQRGTGSATFKAPGVPRNPGRAYFAVNLTALTDFEEFYWQTVYLYEAVMPSPPAAAVPSRSDFPGNQRPTVGVPPPTGATGIVDNTVSATRPSRTTRSDTATPLPTTPPGRDPCQNPQVQACIDRWLDEVVRVLNRQTPQLGPWSTSRYGHLINSLTRSLSAPDGWDTTYHRTRQCFVWETYARAHEDAAFGGEVASLHEQCGNGDVTTGSPGPATAPASTAVPRSSTPPATTLPPAPQVPTASAATTAGTATGGTAGTDTCPGPQVQACIEQWLDQLVATLNRQVSDRAPWSISRYGHLVNGLTRSVGPPEGWDGTYRSSRQCFAWAAYAQVHEDPALGGALSSLHQQCADGVATMGAGVPPPSPVGQPGMSGRTLLAERRTAVTGQILTVPVRLFEPAGVARVDLELLFEPADVRVERVTRGSLLGPQTGLEANSLEAGRLRIGFAEPAGLDTSGIAVNLILRAIGQPGSRTPLTLQSADIRDPTARVLPADLVHGEVIITGSEGRVPGDCDGDGLLTAADALCALKMSVGLITADLVMDANNDRQITSGDSRAILQRIP